MSPCSSCLHGRLADHRRPVLRRPRALAARPGWRGLLGGRPDAPDHRPDGVRRRRGRQLRPGRATADARPGPRPRHGWCARATPSGATTCRSGWRRSRCLTRGRVIGVIARNTNLLGIRTPSRLELSYLQTAADLTAMIATGDFPPPGQRSDHADSPRVGDGFVRIDARRPGHLRQPQRAVGLPPARLVRRPRRTGAGRRHPRARAAAAAPRRGDPERGARRPRPPRHRARRRPGLPDRARRSRCAPAGEHIGALVLVRDVTDLRRRDRELVTKDTTIREIHHRVKNNLQTVAALLRLQARRIESPEAAARPRGGRTPGGLDRDRARDAEPGGPRRGRVRRDRRPAGGDGHRRRRRRRPARRTPGGVVRGAAQRDRHGAGDGAHRAPAERRRARLPRREPGPTAADRGRARADRRPAPWSSSTTTGWACPRASTPTPR